MFHFIDQVLDNKDKKGSESQCTVNNLNKGLIAQYVANPFFDKLRCFSLFFIELFKVR